MVAYNLRWKTVYNLDQKDRVGQDHGKGEHRNHISSATLIARISLIARKRLLVATIIISQYRPPQRSQRENGSGPGAALGHFRFFFIFFIFDFFPIFPK